MISSQPINNFVWGLPLPPGPSSDGIATLAEVREHPEWLSALDLDEKTRYPVQGPDLAHVVALVDAAPEAPTRVRAEFPAPHLLLPGVNLVEFDQTCRCMDECHARLGGIDVLVNVAGGFAWQTLADGEVDTWDRLFDMNLRTAVVATKAALRHMRARHAGRIINIGAGAAGRAAAGMGPYAASKAGVERLTESLSSELKDEGITVNAILPGTIDTPRNRADMRDADFSRWVAPEAVAEVIAFLASDAAAAVTGAAIRVTGRG